MHLSAMFLALISLGGMSAVVAVKGVTEVEVAPDGSASVRSHRTGYGRLPPHSDAPPIEKASLLQKRYTEGTFTKVRSDAMATRLASVEVSAEHNRGIEVWTVDGCYANNHDPEPTSIDTGKASVRCCSIDGKSCTSQGCKQNQRYVDAEAHCTDQKMRLCSRAEVEKDLCCGSGCGFDWHRIWTSTPATTSTTTTTTAPIVTGYDFLKTGHCTSNWQFPSEINNAKNDIAKCAQVCSNYYWNGLECNVFSFKAPTEGANGNCLIFDDGVGDCNNVQKAAGYQTYKRKAPAPIAVGQPGGNWSLEEMLTVRNKLYALFRPVREHYIWGWQPFKEKYRAAINKHFSAEVPDQNIRKHFSAMVLLRLVFHDCMKNKDGSGGCDGCIDWHDIYNAYTPHNWKFVEPDEALTGAHNAGLEYAMAAIHELYVDRHFPGINTDALHQSLQDIGKSRADLVAFAAKVATEWGIQKNNLYCSTPGQAFPSAQVQNALGGACNAIHDQPWCEIKLDTPILATFGRRDCAVTDTEMPYKADSSKREAAPNPLGNGDMTYQYFKDWYGMTMRQTVAIMGAHTFAQSFVLRSGFRYGWTSRSATLFNNVYYRLLVLKPEYRYDNDECEPIGNAFGEKPAGRFYVVAWGDLKSGGPIQWINEKHVCGANCRREPNNECCKNIDPDKCKPDRASPQEEDPHNGMGCEHFKLISGADETMNSPDMGLYYNFTVDPDGGYAVGGCGKVTDPFILQNWNQSRNWMTTADGLWDGLWAAGYRGGVWANKAMPACPKNAAGDAEDLPVTTIIEQYADDNNLFANDFVNAYQKMVTNGVNSPLMFGPDDFTPLSCDLTKDWKGICEYK